MQTALEVYLPYDERTITQEFAANANPLYAGQGLRGHTSTDWGALWDAIKKIWTGAFWGAKIPNCTLNAFCYSTINADNPDPSFYRAAFFLVEGWNGFSNLTEVSYGHMSTVLAQIGKTYQPGDTIGLVGNTGDVYAGGHEVTREERLAGSHAGTHLHGPQLRPVTLVAKRTKPVEWYIRDANGYVKRDGKYIETINYNNGYNGCIPRKHLSTKTLAIDWKPEVPTITSETVTVLQHATDSIAQLPKKDQGTLLGIIRSILAAFGIK